MLRKTIVRSVIVSVLRVRVLYPFAQLLDEGGGDQESRFAEEWGARRCPVSPGGLIDLAFGA